MRAIISSGRIGGAGPGRRSPAACGLALAVVGAAIFGILPAAWETIEYLRFSDAPGSTFVGRWALLLLLMGLVQAAYGILLLQVPDTTTVKIVTAAMLGMAGLYAMGLAIALVARPEGWIAGSGGLQLADQLAGGRAAWWCLCMTSVSAVLAFFLGRLYLQGQSRR